MDVGLSEALKVLDATDANLARLELLWEEMEALIPGGAFFDYRSEDALLYEEKGRDFARFASTMPAIDGLKVEVMFIPRLGDIGRGRFEAQDIGGFEYEVQFEEAVTAQADNLREYRYSLQVKRRSLVRPAVEPVIGRIESALLALGVQAAEKESNDSMESPWWERLREYVSQLSYLLGRDAPRTSKWADLHRHLRFAQRIDFRDIAEKEWPVIKELVSEYLYNEPLPIPVAVSDLAQLVPSPPSGPVVTGLAWKRLDASAFERLLFNLISGAPGYENPQWLTQTAAPDRGRDLSVDGVRADSLAGVERRRIIIQCKHWLSRSVAVVDVAESVAQMRLWQPPRVDVLVFATSGRFTSDAVGWIEKHNETERMRVEMWPEPHLERLVVARPDLLASFGLREGGPSR